MTSEFAVAVHALVYLSHRGGSVSSEALAENICTNPARVRRVLSGLKKAGLVETKEGADGGYRFLRDPKEVTLGHIAQVLDVQFVGAAWRSGDSDMECLIASGMADIMDGFYADMDRRCHEYLQGITIADINQTIFG